MTGRGGAPTGSGGNGNPPTKLMLSTSGTGPLAFAGKYMTRFITGPSGFSPKCATTCFRTAEPSIAAGSVATTSKRTFGAELGTLYARYLHEAGLQALLGALAVCVLLALHLRSLKRLWRIAQPVAAAVLIVLAVFSASGAALGILHLVGLLLTVAIGSNYALFFDQIRAQQDAAPPGAPMVVDNGTLAWLDTHNETLASLALANLTAVISFCLLAFSSIPALFAIGQVVAPGILLCLVLSAAFIGRPPP